MPLKVQMVHELSTDTSRRAALCDTVKQQALSLLWMGDLDLDNQGGPLSGRLAETYEDSHIHFFALNLRVKF